MKKRRLLTGMAVILLTVVSALIFSSGAYELESLTGSLNKTRADLIVIDGLRDFGPLERPEVVFMHDLHTDALEKKGKDCITCHLMEKEDPSLETPTRLSPKFKRYEDISRKEVMDIYHTECMACHREVAAAGDKTGPVEVCGECHMEEPKVLSSRQAMGMDLSLHYRHLRGNKDMETGEGDCKLCHHEYNEETKKLFYAKGKEGTCHYCHKEETEENRISMRLASHLSCIDCHRKKLDQEKETASDKKTVAGPVKCGGCHDFKAQERIEKVKDMPRLKREQPDIVFVKVQPEIPEADKDKLPLRMNAVPFDHKAHEFHNDTCRVCHHESLDSCAEKCHTLTGSKEGNHIRLEQAMHQTGFDQSCIGCHEAKQGEKECAGCHGLLKEGPKQMASFCLVCHMEPLEGMAEGMPKPEAAALLLQSRKAITTTYTDEDIPEKVTVGHLTDKYEPVEFPHRKIVRALMDKTKDNKLAQYFHSEEGTICQACHHNSPISKKPPGCVSCHGKPFDQKNLLRPGLNAAYHQQCMSCHKKMGIEKPKSVGCTECHKESGKAQR